MNDSQFPGEVVADETDGVDTDRVDTDRVDTDRAETEGMDATPDVTPGVADDLKGIVLPHDPTLEEDA
jgi:hypothetical protein